MVTYLLLSRIKYGDYSVHIFALSNTVKAEGQREFIQLLGSYGEPNILYPL